MENLGDYSILLFGEKKIGKTTLASYFPNTLFLMTEPGGKALSIFQLPITDWVSFKKTVRLLRKDKRFQTIGVDTIDLLYKMCERYVCDKLGITDIAEADWGKGWRAVKDEFTTEIQVLMSLGKGIILVSHSEEKEVKLRSGATHDRIQPTMAKQAREVVEAMIDIWAYYTYDGQQRVLQIRGDENTSAGHRLQSNFKYNGKEVREISMGTSGEDAYRNVVDCFHNRYAPTTKKREEADTPVPVKKSVIKRRKV
jgi:GTPase SAR1 family protein